MKLSIQKITLYRLLLLGFAILIASVMAMAQVPKPVDVFGFEPGADYKLANTKMLLDYCQRLDKASNRVQMVTIGKSMLGKPLLLFMVSGEANMKQLEKWRSTGEQLSRAKIDDNHSGSGSKADSEWSCAQHHTSVLCGWFGFGRHNGPATVC